MKNCHVVSKDTQISPQKLSPPSRNSSNSEEELVINRTNWLNASSFQPFGSSSQDTPSSVAADDVESNEMSSTNSIEELQSRSSSSSQDLLSRNSSEEELVFNRNNIIFDLSSSNKRDNDDVKNSKNELLSSSIEEELVFSRPVLTTDNESQRKSSSINT